MHATSLEGINFSCLPRCLALVRWAGTFVSRLEWNRTLGVTSNLDITSPSKDKTPKPQITFAFAWPAGQMKGLPVVYKENIKGYIFVRKRQLNVVYRWSELFPVLFLNSGGLLVNHLVLIKLISA